MSGQEVVQRTSQELLVAQVRSDQFRSEVALALPENVTPERFVRVAITALQASPNIADLERASVMRSLLQSAAMGLMPDGREAAIVPFKGKATLIPMIAGYRLIAADYGWTIYTAVAFENDLFEYEQGLDVRFRHVPVRPGTERGNPIAAYAVGKHQDGRRELEVLTVAEVEKIRATSQTARKEDAPWTQWWEQMAEKSAGKRLFKKLPLAEDDKRVRIVRAALDPAEAAAALYGPEARAALAPGETVDPATGAITSGEAPADPADGQRAAAAPDQQAAEAVEVGDTPDTSSAPPPASAAPDDEPEPTLLDSDQATVAELAGQTVVESGGFKDKTLAEIAAITEKDDKDREIGPAWLEWAAAHPNRVGPTVHAALQAFKPELFPES